MFSCPHTIKKKDNHKPDSTGRSGNPAPTRSSVRTYPSAYAWEGPSLSFFPLTLTEDLILADIEEPIPGPCRRTQASSTLPFPMSRWIVPTLTQRLSRPQLQTISTHSRSCSRGRSNSDQRLAAILATGATDLKVSQLMTSARSQGGHQALKLIPCVYLYHFANSLVFHFNPPHPHATHAALFATLMAPPPPPKSADRICPGVRGLLGASFAAVALSAIMLIMS